MKAICYHQYGDPSVLQLEEVDKPTPKENEVLVKVEAVALNPYDWHYMRGEPRFMRMGSGLFSPKATILGNDIAGTIESVGANVSDFKPGDQVLASAKLGGLAEYVCVEQDRIALKPKNASMEVSACLNIAAVTALESVDRFGDVSTNQNILVNGASGGVGHYCIQLAKLRGASVTGVCSGKNENMVLSLGADRVIDYTKDPLTDGTKYDVIIDTVGNLSIGQIKALTTTKGRALIVGFQSMSKFIQIIIRSKFIKPSVKVVMIEDTGKRLKQLCELTEAGKLKTVIDKVYPLEECAAAMTYLETGHVPGKVVVSLT